MFPEISYKIAFGAVTVAVNVLSPELFRITGNFLFYVFVQRIKFIISDDFRFS